MVPLPPEEIAPLMQFIAEKAKNVKSQLNIMQLCRQFKKETGSLLTIIILNNRINKHRNKIHKMNEFDTETKVKMIFALSASIDEGFLLELKKVADVEVDDKQRIIHYKQKDGRLEFSATKLRVSMNQGEEREKSIIQFLVDKSKTTEKPIADKVFLREFKERTAYPDSNEALEKRYRRVKNTIFELSGINKKTKIKMMFVSNAQLSDNILAELRKDAIVNVDEAGKITEYKANDGRLKLEGDHSRSAIIKAAWARKKKRMGFNNDSDEDIDYEFDNQTEMSTKRKKARISSPPSEIVEGETPEGEGPSTSSPLSISLLEFLNRLRRPAIKLNIPFVANKISSEIEILKKKDKLVPIDNIIESLEEFIEILETPDKMASDNDIISLSDYLYHLGLSMCYIAHPLMNDFQKKLRNLLAAEDQQIPLEHIRYAMDKVLEKINR